MKIAIIGFGNMGKTIRKIAEERNHTIVAIIDPIDKEATSLNLTPESLQGVEVAIDFSSPSTVLKNIEVALEAKVNLVVGTTGWYDQVEEVSKKVAEAGTGFLWSANFSIGVNLYLKMIERAAELINDYEEYDIWGHEIHHHHKVDSPSGTAKTIEKILLNKISRKTAVVEEKLDRQIKSNEIHFSSTRGGPVNFSHVIAFDSAADTITLNHTARDRSGYALGAVKAAEWLYLKKGFFGMDDFIG
ncbi:4-hydroxy-tetrahydrodipicolinate reductase [Candidatus Azambacteria bacterium]|nr:4-hydroxy-tetrahydrodipicolinate reductase [Candidatus Azambacteria bacterium]